MPKTHNLFRDLPCQVEGCGSNQAAKGLCRDHYQRHRRVLMATNHCLDCGKSIPPDCKRCQACDRNRKPAALAQRELLACP